MASPMRACTVVAQVAEQERGGQPDDAEAADERDQQSVDERERRGQQPEAAGAAKGKRRRARSGSTRTATAGTANHRRRGRRARRVAPDHELEHARDRQDAISSSNQYSRAST